MTLFLFLKQIVDMFYEYRLPDYLLAGAAAFIAVYYIFLTRPKFRLILPDICVLLLIGGCTLAYFRGGINGFHMYGKIMSAFLMYFVGRICYKRIAEGTGALAVSSYIVVYANVVARAVNVGFSAENDCGVYYYGTDLGFAMLLSLIFIAMYAKNGILKFLTIFLVCPYMILHTDAGVQQVLLVVVYVILFIYMAERAVKKRAASDLILPVAIVGLLATEAALIVPVFSKNTENAFTGFLDAHILETSNLASRYRNWLAIWDRVTNQGAAGLLFGINENLNAGNQYMTVLNIMGLAGILIMLVFIISVSALTMKTEDRKNYYVTVLIAILFLGTCINVNGMEFSQMSWFPMLYAGLVATARNGKV